MERQSLTGWLSLCIEDRKEIGRGALIPLPLFSPLSLKTAARSCYSRRQVTPYFFFFTLISKDGGMQLKRALGGKLSLVSLFSYVSECVGVCGSRG